MKRIFIKLMFKKISFTLFLGLATFVPVTALADFPNGWKVTARCDKGNWEYHGLRKPGTNLWGVWRQKPFTNKKNWVLRAVSEDAAKQKFRDRCRGGSTTIKWN